MYSLHLSDSEVLLHHEYIVMSCWKDGCVSECAACACIILSSECVACVCACLYCFKNIQGQIKSVG